MEEAKQCMLNVLSNAGSDHASDEYQAAMDAFLDAGGDRSDALCTTGINVFNCTISSDSDGDSDEPLIDWDAEEGLEAAKDLFSEVFEVEDGWAHFLKNYANRKGEMNKSQFSALLKKVLPFEEIFEDSLKEPITGIYGMLGGNEKDQDKVGRVLSKLAKKVPSYLPIVTNALFRYFDADGSGKISKDEVCLAFGGLFCGPNGPNLKILLPAIFRTLDADNSGSIEAVELQPFIVEMTTAVAKLLTSLIQEFETDFKSGGLKKKVLKKLEKQLKMMQEDDEDCPLFPITKEQLLEMIPMFIPDFEEASDLGIFDIEIPDEVMTAAEGFFAKFEEVSEGKPIPIKRCAELMETFTTPVVDILDPELVRSGLDTAWEFLEESESGAPFDLDAVNLDEILPVVTNVMKAYLKSGAQKRYFTALISFLDVNNDGNISIEELRGLWDGFIAVKTSSDEVEYTDNLKVLMAHVFDVFDSDGSGTFTPDDLPLLYDKCVELAASLSLMIIECFKAVTLALVMPALNIALSICTEDGSISMDMAKELGAQMFGDDDE